MSEDLNRVMVVGGGIAGMSASLALAESGISVELVEKSCFLGGHAAGYSCKATDSCRQCGACTVETVLKKVASEPKIHVHLATEIQNINKEGGFNVALSKSSISPNTPLLKGYSKNNKPLFVVTDPDGVDGIPPGAVNFADMGTDDEIRVDAVVLATGFSPFDPRDKPTYGYGTYENVVSGLDLENIKRENGRLVRPSDGSEPEKVAFIQCVGSRDERLGHLWCSRVCCAYGVRSAHSVKYHKPESDVSVFYMDIQNIGKDFPMFYERVKSELNFVRTIPVDVYPEPEGKVRMRYFDEEQGLPTEEIFDMVVLSNGIMPGKDNAALAGLFDVELDDNGFFAGVSRVKSVESMACGVFIAGTAAGPKTIAESVSQAGDAAVQVMKFLEVN